MREELQVDQWRSCRWISGGVAGGSVGEQLQVDQ